MVQGLKNVASVSSSPKSKSPQRLKSPKSSGKAYRHRRHVSGGGASGGGGGGGDIELSARERTSAAAVATGLSIDVPAVLEETKSISSLEIGMSNSSFSSESRRGKKGGNGGSRKHVQTGRKAKPQQPRQNLPRELSSGGSGGGGVSSRSSSNLGGIQPIASKKHSSGVGGSGKKGPKLLRDSKKKSAILLSEFQAEEEIISSSSSSSEPRMPTKKSEVSSRPKFTKRSKLQSLVKIPPLPSFEIHVTLDEIQQATKLPESVRASRMMELANETTTEISTELDVFKEWCDSAFAALIDKVNEEAIDSSMLSDMKQLFFDRPSGLESTRTSTPPELISEIEDLYQCFRELGLMPYTKEQSRYMEEEEKEEKRMAAREQRSPWITVKITPLPVISATYWEQIFSHPKPTFGQRLINFLFPGCSSNCRGEEEEDERIAKFESELYSHLWDINKSCSVPNSPFVNLYYSYSNNNNVNNTPSSLCNLVEVVMGGLRNQPERQQQLRMIEDLKKMKTRELTNNGDSSMMTTQPPPPPQRDDERRIEEEEVSYNKNNSNEEKMNAAAACEGVLEKNDDDDEQVKSRSNRVESVWSVVISPS